MFVTNLSLQQSYQNVKFFGMSKSSSMVILPSRGGEARSEGSSCGPFSLTESPTYSTRLLSLDRGMREVEAFVVVVSVNSKAPPPLPSPFQISVICRVLCWTQELSSPVDADLLLVHLKVFCVTEQRAGLYLLFRSSSLHVGSLAWLVFGAKVRLQYAMLKGYDRTHDIYDLEQVEHSEVSVAGGGGADFAPLVLDDELARFAAIKQSLSMYESPMLPGRTCSTARTLLHRAALLAVTGDFSSLRLQLSVRSSQQAGVLDLELPASVVPPAWCEGGAGAAAAASEEGVFWDIVVADTFAVDAAGELRAGLLVVSLSRLPANS